MQLIRGSEIQDFLRCRKRWSYRWLERIQPKRPDGKLWFGNLIHKFLQEYYSDTDYGTAFEAMQTMFEETPTHNMEQTKLDEIWDLACKVSEGYVSYWKQADEGIQVIATELTFAVPLTDDICYTGTIDKIFKDKDGKVWFSDYKTTSSIERYLHNIEMDRQISRYWWALQQLARGNGYILETLNYDNVPIKEWIPAGEWVYKNIGALDEPHGFVYDIIFKDYPEPPKDLKKGGLSKDKSQRTTYDLYIEKLRELGLITKSYDADGRLMQEVPADYWDILEHLKNKETPEGNAFFRRVKVLRNQQEIDASIGEFVETIKDMTPDCRIYRTITHECHSMCQYKALCLAEMDGSNAGMVRSLAYEPIPEDELNFELEE